MVKKNELVRTIKIPLIVDSDNEPGMNIAMEQCRNVAVYASIMLPSLLQNGVIKPSGKEERKALDTRIYNLVKKIDHTDVVNTSHLQQTSIQMTVEKVVGNFKTSSKTYVNKLWRTPVHKLLNHYVYYVDEKKKEHKMWEWLASKTDIPEGNSGGGKALLELASKQWFEKGMLITEIMKSRKPINAKNRPTYGQYENINLHNTKQLKFCEDGSITLMIGIKNKGHHYKARLDTSKIHDRSGLLKENNKKHYQESWIDLISDLETVFRNGTGIILKREGRWWLHLVIRWPEQKIEGKPKYFAGIHLGIYRLMTLVVLDENGKLVKQYIHNGKEMMHQWKIAHDQYSKRQRAVRKRDMDPLSAMLQYSNWKKNKKRPVYYSKLKDVADKWMLEEQDEEFIKKMIRYAEEEGYLRKEMNGWRRTDKRWIRPKKLSKQKISRKYSWAARFEVRASRTLHHNLHNATINIARELKKLDGPVELIFHDFTGVRDKANRLKHLIGEDEALPRHVRKMAGRWPFSIIDFMLKYKMRETGNVRYNSISPGLACTNCSKCNGIGEHGDTSKKSGIFYEHWHSKFRCFKCGKELNADINAAWGAAQFAKHLMRKTKGKQAKPSEVNDLYKDLMGIAKKRKKKKNLV